MAKTHATERLMANREPKEFTGIRVTESGKPKLQVVEKVITSDSSPIAKVQPPLGQNARKNSMESLPGPEMGWERFHQIAHELPPLFMEHWKEASLEKDPLDPDWDRYYQWDVQGVLRILTVRIPSSQLVGYLFLLVSTHLDHKTIQYAQAEKFWLDPIYRQGWTGVKLFKEAIQACTTWGVKELAVPVELHMMDGRLEKLLKRLGFRPVETIHARRLP